METRINFTEERMCSTLVVSEDSRKRLPHEVLVNGLMTAILMDVSDINFDSDRMKSVLEELLSVSLDATESISRNVNGSVIVSMRKRGGDYCFDITRYTPEFEKTE